MATATNTTECGPGEPEAGLANIEPSAPAAATVDESATAPSSSAPTVPAPEAAPEASSAPASDAPGAATHDTLSQLGDKVADALLRQIEYYFSDLSFPYDSFLQGEADEDGAVRACTLAGAPAIVNKLSQLSAAEREAAIIEVTRRSDSVRLTSDAESDARIARIYPLPTADEAKHRSVYLSGVAKTLDEQAAIAMLHDAEGSEKWRPVVSVRRLRDLQRDRAFTGQLVVRLDDEGKAGALLRAVNKGAIACNKGKILADFYESQDRTIQEQKEKRAAKEKQGGGGGSSAKRAAPQPSPASEAERNLVLRFEGAGATADRECVQEACSAHAEVAYINFSRGEKDGCVRFKSQAGATAALEKLAAGTADIGGAAPSWRRLSAEEEDKYFAEMREARQHSQKRPRGGGSRGRGYGRGRGGR